MRLGFATLWLVVLISEAPAASQDDLQKLKETGNCPECDLRGANLSGFVGVGVDLRAANLTEANLDSADLMEAHLYKANLSNASLVHTNLSSADLSNTDLSFAILSFADLSNANLYRANLSNAILAVSDLSNAKLIKTDLSNANLFYTNLNNTNLVETNLSQAKLLGVDLTNSLYEPIGTVPAVETMWNTTGLSTLRWDTSPHGLNALREAFRNGGMRLQERQVTYSIKHWGLRNAGGIGSWLQFILFEVTCDFGLSPGRPLLILAFLFLGFSIVYMISIGSLHRTESGIWRVWEEDRVMKNVGAAEPQRVTERTWRLLLWGLWYSTISTFHFGWRDLNVGNWIARINPNEYALRPTGWVKSVSGIQSLIGVYLVALSALSYFGRPFG